MGSLFKSKTTVNKAPYENNPWEPQQPFLKYGFEQGKNQLATALGNLGNFKDPVANLTQDQQALIQKGINNGSSLGDAGMQTYQQGKAYTMPALSGVQGSAQKVGDISNNLLSDGRMVSRRISGASGAALSSGLSASQGLVNQAQQGAAAGINQANGVGQQAGRTASQYSNASAGVSGSADQLYNGGQIGNVIGDAQKVANNPYLQGQIDSAIGDVQRGFQGQQAEINAAASGAGGMNSTRAGLLESKALEAAQRQAGDISTGMRSDAYNTGLQTALQNKNLNNTVLNTKLGAIGQAADIANAGHGLQLQAGAQAADIRNSGFANNLAANQFGQDVRNSQIQNQLAGSTYNQNGMQSAMSGSNSQAGILQGLAQLGHGMSMDGAQLGIDGTRSGLDFASILQQQNQNEIDGSRAQNQEGLDLLQKYFAAVGGNYGSNGYQSTVSKSPSPFQTAIGTMATVAGMVKGGFPR